MTETTSARSSKRSTGPPPSVTSSASLSFIADDVDWLVRDRSISSRFSASGAARPRCSKAIARSAQARCTGYQVENLLVDGDRAAALIRLTSIVRATGKVMSVRTSQFSRFRDGKIVEMRAVLDSYDMVEQTSGGRSTWSDRRIESFRSAYAERIAPRAAFMPACGRSHPPRARPTSPIVETDIPARLDRLPWGRFHTLVVVALGITWILDGLEVTLAGTVAGALKAEPGAAFSNADVGPRRQRLSRRRGARRAVLRLAHRPARAQEAVLHHAHRLSAGDRRDGVLLGFVELSALPLHHRRGHRRRICGDQLDHPGTDPGAGARLDRSRDQRHLLGRRGARRARARSCCSIRRDRSRAWLARRVPDRRGAGA